MTPEEIAAHLEAEADGLEASGDPSTRAAAKRLRLWAKRLQGLSSEYQPDTLPEVIHVASSKRKIGAARVARGDVSPLVQRLRDERGMSLRELAIALKERAERLKDPRAAVSQPHLSRIFAGKAPCPPAVAEGIREIAGLDVA